MAQTTRMERGMAVLDLAAGTLQRGRLERIVADADRCAELEKLHEKTCDTLEKYQAGYRDRCDRVAELEGYLQQSKDDYTLALQENEKLRAGLEKVREIADLAARQEDGGFDSKAVFLNILVALAGVDHSPSDTND